MSPRTDSGCTLIGMCRCEVAGEPNVNLAEASPTGGRRRLMTESGRRQRGKGIEWKGGRCDGGAVATSSSPPSRVSPRLEVTRSHSYLALALATAHRPSQPTRSYRTLAMRTDADVTLSISYLPQDPAPRWATARSPSAVGLPHARRSAFQSHRRLTGISRWVRGVGRRPQVRPHQQVAGAVGSEPNPQRHSQRKPE